MQTNSKIYHVENLKYRITDPINKWVEVVGVVGEKRTISKVVVPSSVTIGGVVYKVTSIGDMAFCNCKKLESITILHSVTKVGFWAFWGCDNLTHITLPSSVISIGESAFSRCSSLRSIMIPHSMTSIGKQLFEDCSSLTSINIPNSVTSIGYGAFAGCYSLTSINIPSSVTSIGDMAFWKCDNLISITIPNHIKNIENLHIPKKARIVQKGFTSSKVLDSSNVCVEVTSKTGHLEKNNIYSSVGKGKRAINNIGEETFSSSSNQTTITIPSSMTSIEEMTFSSCYNLTEIKVDPNNPIYDSRNNCNAIIETQSNTLIKGCASTIIPNSVTSIGEEAFAGCSNLTSITIPSSVKSIGEKAFRSCKSLISITIPSSVKSIGNAAFRFCESLTQIKVNSGNLVYDSRNNCNAIIESQSNTLIKGCASTIIPNSVTSIGDGAFSGCSSLTSIFIPNSVTSIGRLAFLNCRSLTSITIPGSVTSIGESAFTGCERLKTITLPTHIQNIDKLYNTFSYKSGSMFPDIICGFPLGTRIIRKNVKVLDKLELHYSQGLEFHKLADYDQAFENFKEAATKPFQFAPAQGEYAELLYGVHKHIMNNEMSQAQQAYNIYTNLTGKTCSIVEMCLKAGGIPESMKTDDGHAGAQYYMGLYYERGYSVQKDFAEAIKWYRRAAEQGHTDAQCYLGLCYYKGNGVPQDYTEAVEWWRKAAELDYAQAQYNLGWCYYNGEGVTQNYAEAAKWYRRAAEQGYADAQYNLGMFYAKGNGVPQNFAEAIKWYRKAAEQGHTEAQFRLGVCYYIGEGVDKSTEEAIKYCSKAAQRGHQMAKEMLEYMDQQLG